MKKNNINSYDEKAALRQNKNVVEAADLFSRLSPDLQDAITDLVKTMVQQNTTNK